MKKLPCSSCGASDTKAFRGKTFDISHRGASVKVKGLNGFLCPACGDVLFDPTSAKRYAEAGDKLVLAARAEQRAEIRRIRRKLGLTQTMAAELMGGGHNAFSRYERGEASPMPAVMNLLKLLDRHPHLLKELTGDQ